MAGIVYANVAWPHYVPGIIPGIQCEQIIGKILALIELIL